LAHRGLRLAGWAIVWATLTRAAIGSRACTVARRCGWIAIRRAPSGPRGRLCAGSGLVGDAAVGLGRVCGRLRGRALMPGDDRHRIFVLGTTRIRLSKNRKASECQQSKH
jgi:hypothetical protein